MDRTEPTTDDDPGGDTPRQPRVAGLSSLQLPSLEDVERRRHELWAVQTFLLVALGAIVVIVTVSAPDQAAVIPRPAAQLATVALVVAFTIYAVEKELVLHRLARQLLAERTATVALSSRLREFTALLDAGREVNCAQDLATVLEAILRGVTELLPARTCSVMLREGDELRVVAAVGNDEAADARMPLGGGISGHVAARQEPLLVNGRVTAADFPGLQPRATAVDSAISVPLVQAGELVGVLNLATDAGHEFSEYDLRAVSLFAENAAAAVAKAQLYESSRRQAGELAHRASHDALTDLPNRLMLAEQSTRALQRAAGHDSSIALLFIDLDGFKNVNDAFGHLAGDELLIAVSQRVTGCLRAGDLAARVGGDEFAVLLTDVADERTPLTVADRIVERLRRPYVVAGQSVQITASVGLAFAPRDGGDFDALLRSADRALYAAKRSGKGCWAAHDADVAARGVADRADAEELS